MKPTQPSKPSFSASRMSPPSSATKGVAPPCSAWPTTFTRTSCAGPTLTNAPAWPATPERRDRAHADCRRQTYAFKYVNGHPKEHLLGLPTVMAFGVLADVATGIPVLLSELTLSTALRTAAMSAVAARALARPNSKRMALIGNGAQSEFQALAFHHLLGIEEIRLFDTDRAATEKLMLNLGHTALRLMRCASIAEAVRGADIVTTVTADKTNATILTPDMIEPGMHINGVGGDCPGKTELHPDVLRGATVFVQYEPQTRIEGDLQQMPADFAVTELVAGAARRGTGAYLSQPGHAVRLGRLCAGRLFGPALHA